MARFTGPPFRVDQNDQLLSGLTSEQAKAILKQGRPVKIARGDFLFRQDDRATTLYQVTKGRLRLCQATVEGHQVLLRLIGEGHVFGLRSLNGGGPIIFPRKRYNLAKRLPGRAISYRASWKTFRSWSRICSP